MVSYPPTRFITNDLKQMKQFYLYFSNCYFITNIDFKKIELFLLYISNCYFITNYKYI